MKVVVDTNVLVRSITEDDARQSRLANRLLSEATMIVVPTAVLCELVWVLRGRYNYSHQEMLLAIEPLINSTKVIVDDLAVEVGLQTLQSGGDFADGVIAYEGERLGADRFVSFDKKAVRLLKSQGRSAQVLS